MTEDTRLLTIKNASKEPITDVWDGVSYTFAPGVETTIVHGVALHFLERHPGRFERVSEKLGLAPETVYVEMRLRNPSDEAFTVTWDGRDYAFPAGHVVAMDRTLARVLVERARGLKRLDGKSHQLEVVEGEATEVPAPTEPTAVETPESPAPKQSRKNRKTATSE